MWYAICGLILLLYLAGMRAYFHWHRTVDPTGHGILIGCFFYILRMPMMDIKQKVWFSKLYWGAVKSKRHLLLAQICYYFIIQHLLETGTLATILIVILCAAVRQFIVGGILFSTYINTTGRLYNLWMCNLAMMFLKLQDVDGITSLVRVDVTSGDNDFSTLPRVMESVRSLGAKM